jgi:hypothetical protein
MEDTLDKIVYNFSRVAIIIPVLFIIFGVSMKVMGYNFNPTSTNIAQVNITPTIANQSNQFGNLIKGSSAQEPKLDLKGPLLCEGTFDKFSGELKIKNYNVRGQFKQDNKTEEILVKGDCLYHWQSENKLGGRICGVSQYIPVINALSQFDMLNLNTILSLVPNTKNPTNLGDSDMQQLAKTCKHEDIDDAAFVLPTNITYVDAKLTPSPTLKK